MFWKWIWCIVTNIVLFFFFFFLKTFLNPPKNSPKNKKNLHLYQIWPPKQQKTENLWHVWLSNNSPQHNPRERSIFSSTQRTPSYPAQEHHEPVPQGTSQTTGKNHTQEASTSQCSGVHPRILSKCQEVSRFPK